MCGWDRTSPMPRNTNTDKALNRIVFGSDKRRRISVREACRNVLTNSERSADRDSILVLLILAGVAEPCRSAKRAIWDTIRRVRGRGGQSCTAGRRRARRSDLPTIIYEPRTRHSSPVRCRKSDREGDRSAATSE